MLSQQVQANGVTLRRQLLAALGAPACQDGAPALGRHASAKAVPVLADEAAGLEGSFHVTSPE